MKKLLFIGLLVVLAIMPACKKETQEEAKTEPKGNLLVETLSANRSLYGMRLADVTPFVVQQGWSEVKTHIINDTAVIVCRKVVDADSVELCIYFDTVNTVWAYDIDIKATSAHFAYAEKMINEFMIYCTANFEFTTGIVCPFLGFGAVEDGKCVIAYTDYDESLQHVGEVFNSGTYVLSAWRTDVDPYRYLVQLLVDKSNCRYLITLIRE